jgi:hypothetical protein
VGLDLDAAVWRLLLLLLLLLLYDTLQASDNFVWFVPLESDTAYVKLLHAAAAMVSAHLLLAPYWMQQPHLVDRVVATYGPSNRLGQVSAGSTDLVWSLRLSP